MAKKTKAIRKFLNGLSHQIPATAVSALVEKNENDALVTLLNSSIEALPMGSSIRKSVDEDLFQSVLWLREELEKRSMDTLKLVEAEPIDQIRMRSTDDLALPAMNPILFQHMLQDARNSNDSKIMQKLLSTDYATPEIMVKSKDGGQTIENIVSLFQTSFASGRFKSDSLNSFVGMFRKSLQEGNESVLIKMKSTKAFIGLLHVLLSVNKALLRDLDLIAADDLGKIVGSLALLYLLFPEVYIEGKNRTKINDSDDSDTDHFTKRSNKSKSKKISKEILEQAKRESQLDLAQELTNLYISMSRLKYLGTVVASFTIGLINTILMEDETFALGVLGPFKMKNTTKESLLKDASICVIESMDASDIVNRRQLPSKKFISNGKKRCILIRKWALSVVKSVATPSKQRTWNSEQAEVVENSAMFVLDKSPDGSEITEEDEDSKDNKINESSESSLENASEEDEKTDSLHEYPEDTLFAQDESTESTNTDQEKDKSTIRKKHTTATMLLPPVPEEKEAIPEPSIKITSISSPSKSSNESAPMHIPSTMTGIRTRGSKSIHTSDNEDSVVTPSRKRTKRSTDKQDTSDVELDSQDERAPLRRSRRKTSISSYDSDGSQHSFTPRRSTRKKN